jgi:hypothetical protein
VRTGSKRIEAREVTIYRPTILTGIDWVVRGANEGRICSAKHRLRAIRASSRRGPAPRRSLYNNYRLGCADSRFAMSAANACNLPRKNKKFFAAVD